MATQASTVEVTRWGESAHPTIANITRLIQKEGLRPYMWMNLPNHRYAVRSHGYAKVLYVVEGTLEITLPDSNRRHILRAGDRLDIPAGVRHGTNVGSAGAKCVEAATSGPQRAKTSG